MTAARCHTPFQMVGAKSDLPADRDTWAAAHMYTKCYEWLRAGKPPFPDVTPRDDNSQAKGSSLLQTPQVGSPDVSSESRKATSRCF